MKSTTGEIEWIFVLDDTPHEPGMYLCATDDGYVICLEWAGRWFDEYGREVKEGVIAWAHYPRHPLK